MKYAPGIATITPRFYAPKNNLTITADAEISQLHPVELLRYTIQRINYAQQYQTVRGTQEGEMLMYEYHINYETFLERVFPYYYDLTDESQDEFDDVLDSILVNKYEFILELVRDIMTMRMHGNEISEKYIHLMGLLRRLLMQFTQVDQICRILGIPNPLLSSI